MKKTIITTSLVFLFLTGCRFFHMSPLEIEQYTPSAGYHGDPGSIEITLTFSSDPDRISIEDAFIFRVDEKSQSGQFLWNNRTLTFIPLQAFSTGHEYLVHVSPSAEDSWGNSLSEDFYLTFSTRADYDRPYVDNCVPEDEAELDNVEQPIIITFSEPVDLGSFYKAFSLTPQRDGYFEWTDSQTVQYNLLDPCLWNVEYTIKILKDLSDLQGNTMEADYISTFKPVIDEEAPVLETVEYVYSDGGSEVFQAMPLWDPVTPGAEIQYAFRRDGRIRLSFSDLNALDQDSVEDAFSTVPELSLEFLWIDDYTIEISVNPDDIIWDNTYRLEISEGIKDEFSNTLEEEYAYYFQTDAQESRPPEVTDIYLYSPETNPDDGDEGYQHITYEDGVEFSNFLPAKDGFFDYYINVADTSYSIYISSTFSVFSYLITYTCVTIGSPFNIEIFDDGTGVDPEPARLIEDDEVLIRVHCTITEYANKYGLIEFRVNPGLKDTGGNKMSDTFSLTVTKESE